MVTLLVNKLTKNISNDDKKRTAVGFVCGAVGIFLNLILFCLKLAAGTLSGSISITADAFNNLSDAGSSAVTLGGFYLASRGADDKHPFGHGRIEYISGMIVSFAIIFVGVELLRTSASKILHRSEFVFSYTAAAILLLSILVKLYMALYNKKFGKKINSSILCAVAADSAGDCLATGAVLLSTVFMHFTKIYIDGYVGAIVSFLIIRSGIKAAAETIGPLIGKTPDPDFVSSVEKIVRKNPQTIGIHDLVVHDYGPGKLFVSLHMEVDGSADIFELHDAVDITEREIAEELSCEAVIHMDPIDIKNPEISKIHQSLSEYAKELDGEITIHDLRIVPGITHTNVIFDMAVPPSLYKNKSTLESQMRQKLKSINKDYFAVIKTELSYCG